MFFIKPIYNSILNAIAPIECLGCGQSNNWCCDQCQKILTKDQSPIIFNNYSPQIQKVVCAYNYQTKLVQQLIHACKYDGIPQTLEVIAQQLASNLLSLLSATESYCLVPVPLHPNRQRERGFNQSQVIAEIISHQTNIPIIQAQRIVNTPHQVGLNGEERQQNMKNVFSCQTENNVFNNVTIIIDDVITTGATINSLAASIAPWCKNIWAAALAKE